MALSNGPRCDYQSFKWVKSMDPYEQLLKIDSNHPHPFKMGKGSLLKIGSLFRVKANKLSTLPGCFHYVAVFVINSGKTHFNSKGPHPCHTGKG